MSLVQSQIPAKIAAVKKALIHRYDNAEDLLEVISNGYSDSNHRRNGEFELLIVLPTKNAQTSRCVIASARSEQYPAPDAGNWPGKPGPYR